MLMGGSRLKAFSAVNISSKVLISSSKGKIVGRCQKCPFHIWPSPVCFHKVFNNHTWGFCQSVKCVLPASQDRIFHETAFGKFEIDC